MYNGVEATAVKGTGLSGYVQRSRVNVTTAGRSAAPLTEDEVAKEGGESINPLAQRRAQMENKEMASRLAAHHALRDVRLRVLLYREERAAAGVDVVTVDRECDELYASLLTTAKHQLKTQQKAEQAKSAAKFAAAFGIKQPASSASAAEVTRGSAFDRAVQDVEKQRSEEERRQRHEQQLVEHLKRVRREGGEGVVHAQEEKRVIFADKTKNQ
ncbi:hypothetical protein ABB37_09600 [Leptomonas pyrrhocoris]|uniref:CWF21 domain-containing protein n=1 Tax=Leptomonas pyrrhocoris TaxID=157538 RepID=A0A0N0DQX5_LEPPY|nr:hypothetical protein ABB37_09600 [Leptomonas pyrrhocoris]KPA73661.1 hypothetical protein ABB37_09600 [Leptomonas pyrrhocoris]|eukprot:XP_015652100.1 hypothetical protein ABB37_09600 [Leptomonas pyrrhocoris]